MKASKLKLDIVKDSEQQQQTFAIRTLVYLGEQNCPWREEFDGNDYTATHVLGCVDGEPVATARIRWFGEFAKLERLAIRTEFRGLRLWA
jgi:predicted GNAT family N-acyltransferase